MRQERKEKAVKGVKKKGKKNESTTWRERLTSGNKRKWEKTKERKTDGQTERGNILNWETEDRMREWILRKLRQLLRDQFCYAAACGICIWVRVNESGAMAWQEESISIRAVKSTHFLPSSLIDRWHSSDSFGQEFHQAGVIFLISARLPRPIGCQPRGLVGRISTLNEGCEKAKYSHKWI